jgi:hypothetical protein
MPSAGLIAHREDAKNTAGSNNLRILRFLAMKFRSGVLRRLRGDRARRDSEVAFPAAIL